MTRSRSSQTISIRSSWSTRQTHFLRTNTFPRLGPALTPAPSSSSAFEAELDRWGPSATRCAILSLADAQAYCRQLATSRYENFPVVSWLLPKALHQHFYNVYAWCRWADDLGDETGDSNRALELLSWWRGELANCYAGRPTHPVLIALRPTIDEFAIPAEPFEDLISAFEQDQRIKRYDTFDQLRDYCRRSADPVGRLVLRMCRQYTPENVAWSDSICTGLQLANFWQDVNRDLDIGRVYLPREDRERFGYSDSELNERRTTTAFLELMRFEVDRARSFLQGGLPLIPRLPGRLQIDIDLFARGGLKILDRIEAIGYRVWERRPKVTKGDAVQLLIGSMLRTAGRKIGIGRSS